MNDARTSKLSIGELVQATGVSRRTVRYYVQLGLLPPPEGAGRGHYYLPGHVETVLRIKELQGQGLTLEEIRVRLEGPAPEATAPVPEIELATRIRVGEGVEVLVAHGTRPPRPAQIRALAEAAAQILENGEKR